MKNIIGMYLLESGRYLEVAYDPNPMNPRECDELAKVYTFLRNYRSVDENPYKDFDELCSHYGVEPSGYLDEDLAALSKADPDTLFLPVSVYEHGGTEYYAGSPKDHFDGQWDYSIAGLAVVKANMARLMLGVDIHTDEGIEKVLEYVKAELREYSDYANGYVYMMTVYDEDGIEADDLCLGGFYEQDPEESGMLEECSDTIREYLGTMSIETVIGKKVIEEARAKRTT